jgi:hypothetical protein
MKYPWLPYQRPLAMRLAIAGTDPIRLEFPPDQFTVDEPLVFVTVVGAPTEVDISSPLVLLTGVGEVHTYVDLTFQAAAVGKAANVWVMGR